MSDAPSRGPDPLAPTSPQENPAGPETPSTNSAAPPAAPSSRATVAATRARTAVSAPKTEPRNDVVLLGPPTPDGAGVHVLRARDETLEIGELRALQDGKPIVGEVVSLKPREDNPRICDVTQSYTTAARAQRTLPEASHGAHTADDTVSRKGPAKVSSAAYREGWDAIFGKKPTPPGAPN